MFFFPPNLYPQNVRVDKKITFSNSVHPFKVFNQTTAVRGYNVFLAQVACQKQKPQIDNWFLNDLYIYKLRKILQSRVLQVTVVSGYYVFYADPV